MKRSTFFSILLFLFISCNIGQQAKEIKTLTDCQYSLKDVSNIYISGTNVMETVKRNEFSLGSIPSLALGFISKNIPMKADLSVEITNPTNNSAAINYFDYEILLNDHLFTEGTIDQRVKINASSTTEVIVPISTNVYKFLINDSVRNNIEEFLKAAQNQTEATAIVTLRIKPAIYVGDNIVKYPGFIDVKKELSSSLFENLNVP